MISAQAYTHIPSASRIETKLLVNAPVLNLHETCSERSPYVTQAVYGHTAILIEKKDTGWALIETEDGYQGYALIEHLIADDPRWRTSKRLCRVRSVTAMVYPIAGTQYPPILRLPFGSRIELTEPLDAGQERWRQFKLLDGSIGWIQQGDVEKPSLLTSEEMIQTAIRFLEIPYLWGGTSSTGFDCSGFIQTLVKQMGILLPRDSHPQANSPNLIPIDTPNRGDLIFFGEEKIIHLGIYLGDNQIIHATIGNHLPKVAITPLDQIELQHLAIRRIQPPTYKATVTELEEPPFHFRPDNPVPLDHLRHIQLTHWGFDWCIHHGELIVHKDVAQETVEIFQELFDHQYPIEKMLLIDAYHADDDRSCGDNNSSAFCSRPITGSTTEWSYHAYGLAIDINPLLNPYHKPPSPTLAGGPFLNRALDCYGILTEDDPCYKTFTKRGWEWGGHWTYANKGYVDYHHFYKTLGGEL